MSSSFHVCSNCDGSCERIARAVIGSANADVEMRGDIPASTPWGKPDHIDHVKVGIIEYATPSHGGWWVAPFLRARIPACVQIATYSQQGVRGWFEEDADVSWIIACFPHLFGETKAKAACGVLSRGFEVMGKHWDESRRRNHQLALRCVYAMNGMAYGWQQVEGGARQISA